VNYLITGGAGFIGSHLADRLIARNDSVVALDDLSTGSVENVGHLKDEPRFRLEHGSILDPDIVRRLTAETDAVVHLAAAVGVKLIVERPLESFITNIRGTQIVLEAAAESGRKILVTSTSEIYGKNTSGPLHEDADRILGSPLKSRWSYSAAKAADEMFANAYWRERGTPTIIVRLFNTVGPRQTGEFGMVVPRFVRQALHDEDLTVYGDGTQRRCFCHIADVVDALVGVIDHPEAVGGVFNVGSQSEITIDDLADAVIRMTGSGSGVVHIPYDEAYERGFEDMQRRIPDTTRLRELTGWTPMRSFEEILSDVIAFERAHRTSHDQRSTA
jgi:nucleoside-diphosphate-sugar epimerase